MSVFEFLTYWGAVLLLFSAVGVVLWDVTITEPRMKARKLREQRADADLDQYLAGREIIDPGEMLEFKKIDGKFVVRNWVPDNDWR